MTHEDDNKTTPRRRNKIATNRSQDEAAKRSPFQDEGARKHDPKAAIVFFCSTIISRPTFLVFDLLLLLEEEQTDSLAPPRFVLCRCEGGMMVCI
jgi:hypothetical protein